MNIQAFVKAHGGSAKQFNEMTCEALLEDPDALMCAANGSVYINDVLNDHGILQNIDLATSSLMANGDLLAVAQYIKKTKAEAIANLCGEELLSSAYEYAAEQERLDREDEEATERAFKRLGLVG